MNQLYIIVVVNKSQYHEQSLVTRNSHREVISYASLLAGATGLDDDIEIKRIFSVDEFGNVAHHEIQFRQGKLVLEDVSGVNSK